MAGVIGSKRAARRMAAVAVGLTLLAAAPASAQEPRPAPFPADSIPPAAERLGHMPGEVVVRFAPGSTRPQRAAALRRVDAEAAEGVPLLDGTRLVELDGGVNAAVARLEARPDVLWAEPNYVLRVSRLPNDPLFPTLWGLRNVGQNTQPNPAAAPILGTPGIDVNATAAWDSTVGSRSVRVAVIDSGIEPSHPDLAGNLNAGLSRNFTTRPSLDDPPPAVDPTAWGDENGHGTHVAGTIGAVGDNSLGVTGVSWQAELVSVRVCEYDGSCTSANVASGLAYAGQIGAAVANASLGSEGSAEDPGVQVMRQAMASAPGTLFAVAAGNGGADGIGDDVDARPTFPCAIDLPNNVCVASIDPSGGISSFSNYGASTVDLGAPGRRINSTYPNDFQLFADDFSGGAAGWDFHPVPWAVTGPAGERRLTYDGAGLSLLNNYAYASPALSFDLTGLRSCRVDYTVQAGLNGDQVVAVLHRDGAGAAQAAPPYVLGAGGTDPTREYELSAYLGDVSGLAGVRLYFYLEDPNVPDAPPRVSLGDVSLTCFGEQPPGGSYGYLSGTSMAAPHVAGVAALLEAFRPEASVAEMRQAILGSAVPTPSLSGRTVTGGRVNAAGALEAMVPDPPTAPALRRPTVRPKLLRLRGSRARPVKVRLANDGTAPAEAVRVCLKGPKRLVRGLRCAKPFTLAEGRGQTVAFRLGLKRRAKPGRAYRVRVAVTSPGQPTGRASLRLKRR